MRHLTTPKPSSLLRVVAFSAAAAGLLAACGGDDSSTSSGPVGTAAESADTGDTTGTTAATETGGEASDEAGEPTVTIERSRFVPEDVTIAAGGSVEWVNLDPFAHTVTARDDSAMDFDSGELAQDETFTQTFDEPGTFRYFCRIHPTMRGTVVVE